jgi:deoxycytidylate deaminase
MLHRHRAVITRGGHIIARGYNHHVNHYHHMWSQHAEVDALVDLKRKFPVESRNKKWMRDCRLYVVRIGPDSRGNPLKNSLPCVNCSAAIKEANIPVVFYSSTIE